MRLRKLMCKGVFGETSPVRVDFGSGVTRPELPGPVPVDGVRHVIVALLFPERCSDADRAPLREAADPRVALLFEARDRTFRLVRGAADSSVQLHVEKQGDFRGVSKGASDVSEILESRLAQPGIGAFRALNLWQFRAAARDRNEGAEVDLESIGPEAEKMLVQYEQTLEIEEVEEHLDEVRGSIERLRDQFGKGLEVERKLEEARRRREEVRAPELTAEEVEILDRRDERVSEYRDTLDSLEENERDERRQVQSLEPDPPWQDRKAWFWGAIGIAAVAVSIAEAQSMRWVALVGIFGFGVAAWTFLRYLDHLEEANIHKVRIESLRRRSTEVREEMTEFRERVDHLLVHEDADSPEELLDRRQRADRLDEQIEKLEERVDQLSENEDFQEAKQRLASLESDRERLEERRGELPEYGADLFQLENKLHASGVDPEAALRARRGDEKGAETDSPFELLRDLAIELGWWERGELDRSTRKVWRQMADHALDGAFDTVRLRTDGTLDLGDGARSSDAEDWLDDSPVQGRVLAGTLALALQVRDPSRDRCVEPLLLAAPQSEFPPDLSRRLLEVFRGFDDRAHIVAFQRAN